MTRLDAPTLGGIPQRFVSMSSVLAPSTRLETPAALPTAVVSADSSERSGRAPNPLVTTTPTGTTLPVPVGRPRAAVGALSLVRSHYPNDIDIYDVVRNMRPDHVRALAAQIEAKTGLPISPAELWRAFRKPELILDTLTQTPRSLASGIQAANSAFHRGIIKDAEARKHVLPNPLNVAELAGIDVAVPEAKLVPVLPGLLHGDLPSDLPRQQAKANIVFAEVMDRLARNNSPSNSASGAERFVVSYAGASYDSIAGLLGALAASGHTIKAVVRVRAANFTDLKAPDASGTLRDVPAAILVKTGIGGATIPVLHSELVFSIEGPDLTGNVKWFQGMDSIGFFANDLAQIPAWCGYTTVDVLEGERAIDAAHLSGLLDSAIEISAARAGLMRSGYGVMGVCSDSVAAVYQATCGKTVGYPLLMQAAALTPELDGRAAATGSADYARLASAVRAVHSDADPGTLRDHRADLVDRLRRSMPWTEATSPFVCVDNALATLHREP